MLENRYLIKVNLKKKEFQSIPEVIANDSVVFEVEVWNGTQVLTLESNYTFYLTSLKRGESLMREGTLENNKIIFKLGQDELSETAKVEATVQIFDVDMNRVSSAKFDYKVIKDPSLNGEFATSDSPSFVIADEALLTDTINKSNKASTDSSTALTKATTAESKATNAETTANTVQAQFDEVTKASTIDPQVSQALVGADGKTYTNLSKRFDSVDSSLAQRPTNEEVDTKVAQIVSGSPKGVYSTVTALQSAKPTGDTGTYIVTGNVKEVDSLTISAIPTVAGNVTVTLNGVAKTIAVDPATDTTTAAVATKIRNASFTGWTTGGTGSTITFTKTTGGTNTSPSYSAGTTGATGAMSVTTAGTNPDGNWYYWNGLGSWVAGGVYQGIGVADNTVTPQSINKQAFYFNMFDKTKVTSNYYVAYASGALTANSNISVSDYIPVTAGQVYDYYNRNYSSETGFTNSLVWYKSDKTFLSGIGGTTSIEMSVTAPANAAFARFNIANIYLDIAYFRSHNPTQYGIDWLLNKTDNYEDESVTLVKLNQDVIDFIGQQTVVVPENPTVWNGKIFLFMGDSITAGYSLTDVSSQAFVNLIKSDLGLATSYNYGIGGTRIAKQSTTDTTAFSIRYSSMPSADVVFVMGGTNDYGQYSANSTNPSAPFGTMSDRTNDTFYGALHVLYKGLIQKYLGKPIFVMIEPHRTAPSGLTGDDLVVNPDTGKNYREYNNAIREVAEYYGLPVIDFSKELTINPNIPEHKTNYMPDGLHPNATGHRMIADRIISYLKKW
jgi:lysophospholipase L1-like esterase